MEQITERQAKICQWLRTSYPRSFNEMTDKELLAIDSFYTWSINKLIPKEIDELKDLKEIYIHNNNPLRVPKEIFNLEQLRSLRIDGGIIEDLPSGIKKLQDLEVLRLDNCKLKEFPKEILGLSKLKELSLSRNEIEVVPEALTQLCLLEELDLSDNLIKDLPNNLGELVLLERLDLSWNILRALPLSFAGLEKLKRIYLGSNFFEECPKVLLNLKNLGEINISFNPLKVFTEEPISLPRLEYLYLYNCNLSSLPKGLEKLSGITEVRLGCIKNRHSFNNKNHFDEAATAEYNNFVEDQKKKREDLGRPIYNWLQGFERTKHIELDKVLRECSLELESSAIESIPKEISIMSELEDISLKHNEIRLVPDEILELKSLEVLGLRNNPIEYLPDLRNLPKLVMLSLDKEVFVREFAMIKELKSLEQFNLGLAESETFPEELWQLTNLETLGIASQKKIIIPEDIKRLPKLKELNLIGFTLSEEEMEALKAMIPNIEIEEISSDS